MKVGDGLSMQYSCANSFKTMNTWEMINEEAHIFVPTVKPV